MSAKKIQVTTRIDEEAAKRIDDVAAILGTSRSAYIAEILEMMHTEEFNPLDFAKSMIERKAAEREDSK